MTFTGAAQHLALQHNQSLEVLDKLSDIRFRAVDNPVLYVTTSGSLKVLLMCSHSTI